MREYKNIYKDFGNWLFKKTGNQEVKYSSIVERLGEKEANAFFYKEILKQCKLRKNGFYFFVKFIVGDLLELGYPNKIRFNSLLRKFDKLLQSHKKLAILVSRGHGKSLGISVLHNLYDMFIHSHRRILIISASQEQANRILLEIKNIIENNEWLITKKSSKRWATETIGYNKGYILVKGVGSEILGEHVNRIVLDDILASDASKKLTDQQIEDYVDLTLDPMLLNRNGQMVLVGTTKSASDIFVTISNRIRMEEKCPWKLIKLPAILDYDKKILLCPDRFTWQQIMDKRLSMGALKFAREYQLEFFSRDQSLFPKKYVDLAKEKGRNYTLQSYLKKPLGNEWVVCFGVDVARSGSVSADYSVAIGIAFNSVTMEKRIVHFWRSKGLKISEQAKQLAEISKNFNHPVFLVEKNNMGQDMIDELVDKHNLFVEEFVTGGRGQKKDELIRFLIMAFEREQIIMPTGDEESREAMALMSDELERFCVSTTPAGNEIFRGMGGHDDIVMALAIANRATQDAGVPFAIVGNKKSSNNSAYNAFYKGINEESDLINQIKMGILK